MTFITIKEAKFAADLFVLKSKLESEGIYCRIDGELSAQVLNYIPLIYAKLQVPQEDLEQVRKIMMEAGEWAEEKAKLLCPKCASSNLKIKWSWKSIWTLLTTFMLTAFSFHSIPSRHKTDFECRSCGARFTL